MPVRFLNLLNQILLALNSLTASLVSGIFFARSACNSLAFFANYCLRNTISAKCCSLIHTNNNSTSLIVCDLCFVGIFIPFATSASLISFFFARMELIIDADSLYILASSATRTPFGPLLQVLSLILYCFSPSLSKRTWNFLWPHGGLFSMRCEAYSMRNKGRLSHERMGCFVWVLASEKWVAESPEQAEKFGMYHFQLNENWADVWKLWQGFNEVIENLIVQKLEHTKTEVYLSVLLVIASSQSPDSTTTYCILILVKHGGKTGLHLPVPTLFSCGGRKKKSVTSPTSQLWNYGSITLPTLSFMNSYVYTEQANKACDRKLSHFTVSTVSTVLCFEGQRKNLWSCESWCTHGIYNYNEAKDQRPIHKMEKLLHIWMEDQIPKRTTFNLFTVQI